MLKCALMVLAIDVTDLSHVKSKHVILREGIRYDLEITYLVQT
jgi:hypothetical protein